MKNNNLDDIFDESIQYKMQFVCKDKKLKIVRKKIKEHIITEPSKQLFPISKERQ
jgi:hypothetical protein